MSERLKRAAADLLRELNKEDPNGWKDPDVLTICKLATEYLTLDGLEDARRGADIEYLLTIGTPGERAKEA